MKLNADASGIRTETLRSQEHLVVPAVLLVEGVIQGMLADTPELALAGEFGANPATWNGRPVSVMHPQRNEEPVAAGSPDIWESVIVGFLFNSRLNGTSLESELWLNKTWCEDSGFSNILQVLEDGGEMEVSTGLFSQVVDVVGVWNGKKYKGIWTNCVPDHLALLPNAVGACSIEMGCGTNRNNSARLVVQSAFDHNKSPQENSMPEKTCSCQRPEGTKPGLFQRILGALIPPATQNNEAVPISELEQSFLANLQGISSEDLRTALAAALAASDPREYFYVVTVFDDHVIYEAYDDGNWVLLQRGYSMNGDTVVLASDMVQVRPKTEFVPVSVAVGSTTSTTSTTSTAVSDMQANETSETSETTDSTVAMEEPAAQEAAATAVEEPPQANQEAALAAATSADQIQQQFNATPDEITAALKLRDNLRGDLEAKILAAEGNQFTKDDLKAFSFDQLTKLNATVGKAAASEVSFALAVGAEVPATGKIQQFAAPQAFTPANVVPIAAGSRK